MDAAIDDRRVRYLYEAITSGSVRAAADKLDMNASVVSRQIAQLEVELAMPLMERHGRGVKATDAGQMLIEYFRQHRSHKDDLVAKLEEIRGLSRGHIDLVLGEGFVSDLMGEPLQEFWRDHPNLTLSMHLAGTNEVLRRVAQDESHIGLAYNPPVTPGIRSRVAIRQPMCAIVGEEHPLLRADRQPLLRQLGAFPLALMEGSFGTRQLIALAEQMERVRFVPALTTDSISVIKHFVRAGFGISLMPAFAIAQEIDDGQLHAVTVDQPLLAGAEAHIVTRLGRQLPMAANQLLLRLMSSMRAFRDSRQKKVLQ